LSEKTTQVVSQYTSDPEQPDLSLAGIVCLFLVERQVTAVDARQPFDQALRDPIGQGLLLLGMGYIISGNQFFLWVRVWVRW